MGLIGITPDQYTLSILVGCYCNLKQMGGLAYRSWYCGTHEGLGERQGEAATTYNCLDVIMAHHEQALGLKVNRGYQLRQAEH
ncbi:hypothetical protein ACLB2K_028387 [Fragaria x ananassa]